MNSNKLVVSNKYEALLLCTMATKHDKYTQQQLHNLGERLRSLRKQKGYKNYEKFAYEHDIPRAQYGRYENGEDLRFSSLVKVVSAMGMTMEEFFAEGFE